MSPIIAATDLSSVSDLTVRRAGMIANRLGVPLLVLHTVDNQQSLSPQEKTRSQVLQRLEQQVARCVANATNEVQLMVEQGPVAETILKTASARNAQLLAMGRQYQYDFKPLIGSTLERVSRLSSVPLLMVAGEQRSYDSALLSLDFSACCSEALRCAARLLNGGQLHTLHSCNPPLGTRLSGPAASDAYVAEQSRTLAYLLEDELEMLDIIGTPRPKVNLQLKTGEQRSQLVDATKHINPGFVALGNHNRSAVTEALLGSLALALLREPPCDVLVVR